MDTKKIILSFVIVAFAGAVAFGQESEIRVYPNPASEYVQVQLSSEFTEAIIEVNSMIGNKVRLNVEELGFGKYWVPLDIIQNLEPI